MRFWLNIIPSPSRTTWSSIRSSFASSMSEITFCREAELSFSWEKEGRNWKPFSLWRFRSIKMASLDISSSLVWSCFTVVWLSFWYLCWMFFIGRDRRRVMRRWWEGRRVKRMFTPRKERVWVIRPFNPLLRQKVNCPILILVGLNEGVNESYLIISLYTYLKYY